MIKLRYDALKRTRSHLLTAIYLHRGLAQAGWRDVPIVACETRGADSFAQMLAADKLVTLPTISSIAKTLGASTVAEVCLARLEPSHTIEVSAYAPLQVSKCRSLCRIDTVVYILSVLKHPG